MMNRSEPKGPFPGSEQTETEASAAAGLNNEALDSILLFTLRKTQAVIMQDFVSRFDALDLRPIQLGALLLIRSNPGSRQSDIAAALGIQRPNFVTMMDELDRRGLTQRTTSNNDRRSYSLGLTPQGEALVNRALQLLAEHEAFVSSRLDPNERRQLFANLNRIESGLTSGGR
ncbi:MarR family transcriptional regulator [Rhabdaerophilum sp. SD176]|uniref:MarR family winged helix-turn-helix transcriptional regulator n=1 Tax=Rhabdaerophilum sp. SD176 TaxID=2983548 RepID=UPI0024E02E2D|nr:MarR family transcriptional regulator [Rhabdaerophilum sp. SD176]